MKLILTLTVLSLPAVSFAATDNVAEAHSKHAHSAKCGHKAETHKLADGTTHVDYEHDGHHHFQHGSHFDECKGPEADKTASR